MGPYRYRYFAPTRVSRLVRVKKIPPPPASSSHLVSCPLLYTNTRELLISGTVKRCTPSSYRGLQLRLHSLSPFPCDKGLSPPADTFASTYAQSPAMPHRKQKKNNHALQNGSPRAEPQTSPVDSSPVKGPAQGTTNYREIHQDEADALRSIYGEDFQDVEHRQGAWKVAIPSIIIIKK